MDITLNLATAAQDLAAIKPALAAYQEAQANLDAARALLQELGIMLADEEPKRGRKPKDPNAVAVPYTGKKRGRKPKNAQPA